MNHGKVRVAHTHSSIRSPGTPGARVTRPPLVGARLLSTGGPTVVKAVPGGEVLPGTATATEPGRRQGIISTRIQSAVERPVLRGGPSTEPETSQGIASPFEENGHLDAVGSTSSPSMLVAMSMDQDTPGRGSDRSEQGGQQGRPTEGDFTFRIAIGGMVLRFHSTERDFSHANLEIFNPDEVSSEEMPGLERVEGLQPFLERMRGHGVEEILLNGRPLSIWSRA